MSVLHLHVSGKWQTAKIPFLLHAYVDIIITHTHTHTHTHTNVITSAVCIFLNAWAKHAWLKQWHKTENCNANKNSNNKTRVGQRQDCV